MDKYEFNVIMEEIDSLISERDFKEAARLADTIDWTRVRNSTVLCRISDLYKINRRYGDSLELLEIAYESHPTNRKIIFSLCELELKLNNYIRALQLYNAFINTAPRDPDRYLLQYKLYKKQNVNAAEQITVLESYLQRSFRERWAYELAELYRTAGDEQRCIRQCDEIITYFGKGRFVIRALELKQSLTRLTPQQEELLEILKSGGTPLPNGKQEEGPEAETAPREPSGAEEAAPQTGEAAPMPGEKAVQAEESSAASEPGRAVPQAGAGAAQTKEAVTEDGSAEDAKEDAPIFSQAHEEYADAILRDAKNLIRDANMQEEIARGMRELDDGEMLPKEAPEKGADPEGENASGERPEEKPEDESPEKPEEIPEVGNRIDLEQLMSEWEKIRRENERQRLSEARRRVMDRSAAARRQLYGDGSFEEGGAFAAQEADDPDASFRKAAGSPDGGALEEATGDAGSDRAASTRSWKREDVEKGLRRKQ